MNRKQRKQLRKLKPSRAARKFASYLTRAGLHVDHSEHVTREDAKDMARCLTYGKGAMPLQTMIGEFITDNAERAAIVLAEANKVMEETPLQLTPRQIAARKGAATRKRNKERELAAQRDGHRT